mgnify:CR=1 FL=1
MKKNTKFTAVFVVTVVIGMIGLSYAAVPLYDLFCRTTGFGGTPVTLKEDTNDKNLPSVNIKVQFNSDVAGGLNWKFIPVEREVIVKTGTNNLAFYTAKNLSESAITGIATFNVTPPKIGKYFSKILSPSKSHFWKIFVCHFFSLSFCYILSYQPFLN